jgi:hypothetical protein
MRLKNIVTLLLLFVISTFTFAQKDFSKYQSISIFGYGAALSNYNYEVIQPRVFVGGGINYTVSLLSDLNLLAGITYFKYDMEYTKSEYSDCDSEDGTCWMETNSTQLNIPIGFEFFLNDNNLAIRTYYRLSLNTSFSLKEQKNITKIIFDPEFDDAEIQVDDNGFKFQDLSLRFALGTEIRLHKKMFLTIEPNLAHSILFRTDDVINPNYVLRLDLGLRYRF